MIDSADRKRLEETGEELAQVGADLSPTPLPRASPAPPPRFAAVAQVEYPQDDLDRPRPLVQLLEEDALSGVPVLVLANKQDLSECP